MDSVYKSNSSGDVVIPCGTPFVVDWKELAMPTLMFECKNFSKFRIFEGRMFFY